MLVCQRCRAECASTEQAVADGWAAIRVVADTTCACCPTCKDLYRELTVAFFDGAPIRVTTTTRRPAEVKPEQVVN